MKPHVFLSAFLGLLLCFGWSAKAQFPVGGSSTQTKALPGTAGDTTPKGIAKITGSILDSTQTKSIEFASIALYSPTSQ